MTKYERAHQLWSILTRAAQSGKTLTYDDVSKESGIVRQGVGGCLGPIQSYCKVNNLPPLTIIVIKKSGLPGKGFNAVPKEDFDTGLQQVFDEDWKKVKIPSSQKLEDAYNASPDTALPEEVDRSEKYIEGAVKQISVNAYERNGEARDECKEHYKKIDGCIKCFVCSFDFEKFYGNIGKDYIHIHHKEPLSNIRGGYKVDPINDLVPVCPNCHAMIHRNRKKPALTVEELKKIIKQPT